MRVQTLTWDRVTVTYPESLGNEVIYFKAASVRMDTSGGVSAITIVETSGRRDALNHTYANPRVFELTPWGFKAEAFWFGNDRIEKKNPVVIVGEFDVPPV